MASRWLRLVSIAAAGIIAGGGYFVYSVFAAQARPDTPLAQAPLNTQAQIPPAFIMAVDDSGSMTFQVMLRGLDGGGCWNNSAQSFFDGNELRQGTGGNGDCAYYYLMPHEGYTISRSGVAIPPIDQLGFSRSPEFNPSYFDPSPDIEYGPWLESDGAPFVSADTDNNGNAEITRARANPRVSNSDQRYWFDFTTERALSDTRSRFRVRGGMVLPEGMQYYLGNSCGGLGGEGSWVALESDHSLTSNANCTVGLRYFPATFYLRVGTAPPAGYKDAVVDPDSENRVLGGRALATDACGPDCDMYRYEIRPENYDSSGPYYDAAIQKFANWFSYYGNRNRAMIAGMTRSLAEVHNMRVGYFRLKNRTQVQMYDMQDPNDKKNLYDSMLSLPASGGTPNLRAVDHIGQQFQRPDDDAPIQLACQKNAGMLFTDGFSNDGGPSAPAIEGLGAPFDPTPANSLAAIATQYYLNSDGSVGADGDSSLRDTDDFPAGQVPIPRTACESLDSESLAWKRLNCQSNLHMSFYGITLGARGEYYDPDASPPRDPWMDPPVWPGHSNDQPSTVDDILHATINTRGEFINARTPADITDAMRRILATVNSGSSPSGSIALTGARIGSGTLTVVPSYAVENEGTDWFSRLAAERVTVNPDTGAAEFVAAWEASQRVPAHGSRNIFFTGNGVTASFNSANVTSWSQLCGKPAHNPDGAVLYPGMLLCGGIEDVGPSLPQAINYLRGDTRLEVKNGGAFRDRTTRLGDIVNSVPVISAPTDDYGYRALPPPLGAGPEGPGSYAEYLESKRGDAQNRRYMVYVGANDGMLHAFDGGLTATMAQENLAPDGQGGREKFAYIPATSIGHMGNLLIPHDPGNQNDQAFQHRYYVDGPLVVSDAYYNSDWSTVLVGTSGAGGRSVFGLDVSNASRYSGSFSPGDQLWEISDVDMSLDQEVRDNIGHVLGRPVIVPVKTTDGVVSWKAIFGNGYNSRSGKAVLFLVDIDTGTPQVTMIEAEESGSGVPPGSNGLGNIVVLDRFRGDSLDGAGQDGYADTVYAGDQKGALWKFDLRAPSPDDVTTPLFVTMSHTNNRQPITGGIAAAAGPGGGTMLYFGTGSFSFVNDPGDSTQQSLYAVNDRAPGLPTGTLTRGDLDVGREMGFTDGERTLTPVGGGLGSGMVLDGWYVDLAGRERFVGHPSIAAGSIFMPTYVPDVTDTPTGGCSAGGENWLVGLNARTGAAALAAASSSPGGGGLFDDAGAAAVELTDGDGGSIDSPVTDVAVLVVPQRGAFVPDEDDPGELPPELPEGPGCWMLISAPGAEPMYLPYPCGRQSWRQIQ